MKTKQKNTNIKVKDLKAVRNYFGEHDKTMFEHRAYAILDKFYKKLTQINK